MKKRVVIGLCFVFIFAGIAWISYTYVQMKNVANEKPPKDIPYLIILGAKVNGDKMSKALFERAKVGLSYLNQNKNTKVIVTGGKGQDEDISEAEAVKRYLVQNGISKERILMENQSVNTYENIKFAKKLYAVDKAVIVSNDFHLYRALQLAKSQGIQAYPLAGETPKSVKLKLYVREMLAITKLRILGR